MLIVSGHWTAIYFSWRQAAVAFATTVCINLLEEVKGLPFLSATFSEKKPFLFNLHFYGRFRFLVHWVTSWSFKLRSLDECLGVVNLGEWALEDGQRLTLLLPRANHTLDTTTNSTFTCTRTLNC